MSTLPTLPSSTTRDQLQSSVASEQVAFTQQDIELISRKFIRLVNTLKIILEEESNATSKGTTEKINV